MTRFVLDASTALSWFVDRPVALYAEHAQRSLSQGWTALVPGIWDLELVNGFLKAERRGILLKAEVDHSFAEMARLRRTSIFSDPGSPSLDETLALARTLQLTSYDASYVELAQRQSLPLATLDKGLRAAAPKAGVGLLK